MNGRDHGESGTGFLAQLSARAEMGMNISRRGRGGKDAKPMISGMGMYIYWLIELAAIGGVCGLLSLGATREPFCEKCETWYEKSELGGIVDGKVEEARRALDAKDYARVASCVVRTNPGGALSIEKCPECSESQVVVKLESIALDKKGKEERTTVYENMVAAQDARAMETALTSPGKPPA